MSLVFALTIIMLCAPLASSGLIALVPSNWSRSVTYWLNLGGLSLALLAALVLGKLVLLDHIPPYNLVLYNWGNIFPLNLAIDRLSVVMILLVNFIALLVNIYAIGYLRNEQSYKRFYSYMSLFVFFMLLLVAASNFFLLFLAWEGVSLISYFLISFWFTQAGAVHAGYKAFLINRISDLGLLLGIAAIFYASGSLDYNVLFMVAPSLPQAAINLICILLLIGVIGKSAQMPLHVWLPDAMAGPVPVSALIHSATMVAAGVYLLVRLMPLYVLSPIALNVILIIGTCSALLMGILALAEFDIKRIIAYSTISQLGYMFAAVGVLAPQAAMGHLVNHAGFKALLFLAVGAVMMRLKGATDLRVINQHRTANLLVYAVFLVGALALIGVPPFSGFFSKDAIIAAISSSGSARFYVAALLLGIFVTALYIFRVFFLVFGGSCRGESMYSPKSKYFMIIPLIILALLVIISGFFIPNSWQFLTEHFISLETLIGVSGIFCAWLLYHSPYKLRLVKIRDYGFETAYHFLGKRCSIWFSLMLNKYVETNTLNKFLVNGICQRIIKISWRIRRLHSGYIYYYVLLMGLGLILMLAMIIIRLYA
jgi:NADH-quinone oxidoreductase subunit L